MSMTREQHNHDWLDDPPVDLDTLAALVEGDLGHEQAEAVHERLLAADAELAHQVEMMCQDRVMLRTLGDEKPPEGLAEAVIARLEREALLGLADGDESGPIPISRVPRVSTRRRGGVGRWLTSPAGAGLAMAAVLALAVGVTLQFLPSGAPTPEPEGFGPIALDGLDDDQAGRGAAAEVIPAPMAVAGEGPEAPDRLAVAEAEQPDERLPDLIFLDDVERALALLEDGRLLVRVRCADPDDAIGRLSRLTGRAATPGEAWRLGEEVTEPVALAMHQKFEPVVAGREPVVIADVEGHEVPDALAVQQKASAMGAVYLADARADRAALRSLRTALSLGDGQVAVFEELREPLELPRVVTPESVLWWGRPADEWSARVYLPVVIERLD